MRRGFTLIELLIVIAIMSQIAAFGISLSARSYRRGVIDSERDTLKGALEKARSEAMANLNQSAHGLAVTAGSYVVFQGDSFSVRNAAFDQPIARTGGFTLAGPSEIVFQAIEGTVATSGVFMIGNEVKTLSVEVNQEGRIQW